jgi:hypothetical protein
MRERRSAYSILVGVPEGRRQLGRPGRKWEDIKINFKERRWSSRLGSCGSGWGPVEGSFEHGNEHSGSIKCWEIFLSD